MDGALRRSLTLLVAVAVTLLAACGATLGAVAEAVRDGGPGSFASEARGLPGVADATVEKTALDTDYWSWDAAIDMEETATPEEVAGALDKLAAWAGQAEGEHSTTLTVGAGEASRSDGCWESGPDTVTPAVADHAANLRRARLVLVARRALEESVCVAEHAWKVFASDPGATGRRILVVPELAAAGGLVIESPQGWVGPAGPLTKQFLDAYAASLAAARGTRGGRMSVNSFAPAGVESGDRTQQRGVEVALFLRLLGHEGPSALATPATADPRWPAARAQLDVLRALPEGSQLWLALQHDKGCATCHWDRADELLRVSNDGSLRVPNPGPWQQAAEEYLRLS